VAGCEAKRETAARPLTNVRGGLDSGGLLMEWCSSMTKLGVAVGDARPFCCRCARTRDGSLTQVTGFELRFCSQFQRQRCVVRARVLVCKSG